MSKESHHEHIKSLVEAQEIIIKILKIIKSNTTFTLSLRDQKKLLHDTFLDQLLRVSKLRGAKNIPTGL